jgi:hypothetical protein
VSAVTLDAELLSFWRGDRPETPITVPIDGIETPGVRIDPTGTSAVRLRWDTQTVFCVGDPDIVEQLRLRRAAPEDLHPPSPANQTGP